MGVERSACTHRQLLVVVVVVVVVVVGVGVEVVGVEGVGGQRSTLPTHCTLTIPIYWSVSRMGVERSACTHRQLLGKHNHQ